MLMMLRSGFNIDIGEVAESGLKQQTVNLPSLGTSEVQILPSPPKKGTNDSERYKNAS